MKITEDTKLKDLIPEGYEIDQSRWVVNFPVRVWNDLSDQGCSVAIPVRKKEVKDFNWYVNKYLSSPSVIIVSDPLLIRSDFAASVYDVIPFEIKTGLLKFICDDLKVDLWVFPELVRTGQVGMTKVGEICPKGFIDSIFC